MKIVVLDGFTANPGDLSWDILTGFGEVQVYDRTPTDNASVIGRIGEAEVVLTNKTPLSKEILAACGNLKYIGVLATGYNVVDIKAAGERGICVTNVPGYSTDAVVQMVFAHLLHICHHVAEHAQAVNKGQWQACTDFAFWNYPLIELAGKTLGIVGLGEIGSKVAQIANLFGMRVIAATRTQRDSHKNLAEYVTLEELFASADIISLHCPLTEQTKGLINRRTIAQMKPGVILLNTSRGPLIEEQDLSEALAAGKIAYAGLDVVSEEPIKANNPLLQAPNCYITPHIAWAPLETRQRLLSVAASNLEAWLAGAPVNIVK